MKPLQSFVGKEVSISVSVVNKDGKKQSIGKSCLELKMYQDKLLILDLFQVSMEKIKYFKYFL